MVWYGYGYGYGYVGDTFLFLLNASCTAFSSSNITNDPSHSLASLKNMAQPV